MKNHCFEIKRCPAYLALASIALASSCRAPQPAQAHASAHGLLAPPDLEVAPRESVALLGSGACASGAEQEFLAHHEESYGLAELQALALRDSPSMGMTSARIAEAQAALHQAQAGWLPTVGLEASYLRADAPSIFLFKSIDAGRFLPGTDFNQPGVFSNWEAAISAGFNLYDGGRTSLQVGLANDDLLLARLGLDASRNLLLAALSEAWYAVRSAEEQVQISLVSVSTVGAQLKEVRARFEQGSALRSDVLSLEVRLANSEENQQLAENSRLLGLAALAQLAGIVDASKFQISGSATGPEPAFDSLAVAQAQALKGRPELGQAEQRVGQALHALELSKTSQGPRADAYARGWRDAPALDFDESRDNWVLGLSLTWSVFDARRGPGVAAARAKLKGAQEAERSALLAVNLDVRSAWLRMNAAKRRVEVSLQAVGAADESMGLVRAQYEAGAVTVTRFLESELAQNQSLLRNANARYEYERAKSALLWATGSIAGGALEQP